jgi:branched-chain amino acid transport system ATP-binding protein
MLEVRAVETCYGPSQVLFGVSLVVAAGEVVTLLGRNGVGKTTTVRTVLGLQPPRAGVVLLDGRPIHGLPPHRVAQLGVGLVPEGRQVFPNLTVRENLVAFARDQRRAPAPWTLERIFALFPALAARQRVMGAALSGGEQQMLAIGRALVTNPRLLVLDEAAEGLAPLVRAQIWQCLASLKAAGLSILVIDKNVAALLRIADRHYIMEKGRIAWHGDSTALAADAELRRGFLGV